MSEADFDSLPRFDARDFEPPAWASSSKFNWGQEKKNGESSTSSPTARDAKSKDGPSANLDNEEDDEEDGEETWEDALEDHDVLDLKETLFSTEEIKVRSPLLETRRRLEVH